MATSLTRAAMLSAGISTSSKLSLFMLIQTSLFLIQFYKKNQKNPLKITTKLRNCRGIFPHIHIHTHEYNLCLVHTPENLKIPISNAMYKYQCLFCFDHIILFVCKIGFVVTLFRPHAVITSINLIHPNTL